MRKMNLKKYGTFFVVALALLMAIVLRQVGFHVDDPLDRACIIIRSAIYITLFTAWGISVRDRIIQPQVRRYLVAISLLMVFWIAVRGIRHAMTDGYWLMRHLWYLYYLPMLFIPLLALFVAVALGKPDHFRLSKWMNLMYIPTAVLVLLVLTNDMHQLVFRFPEDAVVWMNDYRYGIVYFLVVGWIIICALTSLVTMLLKCRVPHSRRILALPFVPAAVALIYGILYALCETGVPNLSWLKVIAGDMTVVFCLLFTAVLESCIQCGLIQANTGYEELFIAGRLGAQITNRENDVCLLSSNAIELTAEQIQDAGAHPVFADKNTLVISHPIRFGHVLWQEDVTELTEAIAQIEENCRNLSEQNSIRQKNLETRKNIIALQEKNRATDMLNRATAEQLNLIEHLLTQYDTENDYQKREKILAGAAVVGAYIKRYGNLLLVNQREETADIRDLSRCFEESFANLELLDVKCLCTLPADVTLATKDMLSVYRAFETALEDCLFDLQSVWVNARERNGQFVLSIDFVCDTDLSCHPADADSYSFEDGACRFTFKLQKGGEGE
ncbi:MAG: histidine kinase N-terminal 7TM domain-containing protein [Lachnospiraceae bacterium]